MDDSESMDEGRQSPPEGGKADKGLLRQNQPVPAPMPTAMGDGQFHDANFAAVVRARRVRAWPSAASAISPARCLCLHRVANLWPDIPPLILARSGRTWMGKTF